MNNWGPDQYHIPQNMMGMIPPTMMPPPLLPPMCMMGEMMNSPTNPPNSAPLPPGPLIGPVKPEDFPVNDDTIMTDEFSASESPKSQRNRDGSRGDRRDRERDRSRQQRSNDRYDRNDRDRNDRGDKHERTDKNDRSRRERRSKWDSGNNSPGFPGQGADGMPMPGGVIMPGMMQYGQMNMMQQPAMDMSNMQNMHPMPGMQNMQNMLPGMNMMPNMMGNILDQSMMIMHQSMAPPLVPNQPFYVTNAALLPPIPGAPMPNRRERPNGCRTIFVGGLPNGIKEDTISEIFQRFGEIKDTKLHRQGVCHVRFEKQEMVDQSFLLSGYRFKRHNQSDSEATTLFIDFALNRDDQNEYDKNKRLREPTPPRVETFTPAGLNLLTDKIKSDDQFGEAAPTLAVWLERGECNKRNSNTFYSLVQASNNQIRRLFTEKMTLDEEFLNMKTAIKDKFANIVMQFEQVAKILTAAKHQRVSDHFTKQQRRNIEMWLKMTEEVENIKEEFSVNFDDEDTEKTGKNMVPADKYEELKTENENLSYELEGYKNEAYLAKDEAERKFEKFKAHFVAQQALKTGQQVYPPLPPPSPMMSNPPLPKPQPPPPTPDEIKVMVSSPTVPPSEAKLISILTAFLLVHPLGASLDYLVSYVRSMVPNVTHAAVNQVLQKYGDVFCRKTTGIGASIEHRWAFVTFDLIKRM